MLTPINTDMLAALEDEIRRLTAQVDLYAGANNALQASASQIEQELKKAENQKNMLADALRFACQNEEVENPNGSIFFLDKSKAPEWYKIARAALQACQD